MTGDCSRHRLRGGSWAVSPALAAGPKGAPTIVRDILKLDDIGNCSRRASLALDAAEYKHIGQLEDGAFGGVQKLTEYVRCMPDSTNAIVVVATSSDVKAADKQIEVLETYLKALKNW
jgi:hypothetical protein